jgi:hypothetical protein
VFEVIVAPIPKKTPAIGNKAIGNKNALLSLDMVGIKPLPKFFHQLFHFFLSNLKAKKLNRCYEK